MTFGGEWREKQIKDPTMTEVLWPMSVEVAGYTLQSRERERVVNAHTYIYIYVMNLVKGVAFSSILCIFLCQINVLSFSLPIQ